MTDLFGDLVGDRIVTVLVDSPVVDPDELRKKQPGVGKEDVLRIFGEGCRVVEEPIAEPKPAVCAHCNKKRFPQWRRGRVVQAVTGDGVRYWMCLWCGRRLQIKFTA